MEYLEFNNLIKKFTKLIGPQISIDKDVFVAKTSVLIDGTTELFYQTIQLIFIQH